MRNWGLGALDKIYHQGDVDEVQINGEKNLFVVRKGVIERLPFSLEEGEVERLATRLIMHDSGVSLAENCTAETVRKDGNRVTAVAPPVGKDIYIAIRKHGSVDMSPDNLEKMGTLNQKVWKALGLLVRGRSNILISGNFGAGKTSLLRELYGLTHPALRGVVLESRRELRLQERYPERNIVELEERREKGVTMKKLFETVVVRLSPSIIIVGEFRGLGEAIEAIRAGTKGHKGSMATTHSVSPWEALTNTAMQMLEEGLNLSLDLAILRVAQAYDVIVQMFYDAAIGKRRIESVVEIERNGKDVRLRDLIRWSVDGEWTFKNPPSDNLIGNMARFGVSREEVEEHWN